MADEKPEQKYGEENDREMFRLVKETNESVSELKKQLDEIKSQLDRQGDNPAVTT